MKIVCYKDKIIKALNSVVKGVASKTTMPILEGILIQTNDNEIKLTTYDLEIGIEYVMDCEIKEQGSTVVNAIMFSEIIRKLPDTEISISLNEKNLLEIECEGSLYKLATMNPEEFPELPKIEIENSIDLILRKRFLFFLISSSLTSFFCSKTEAFSFSSKFLLFNSGSESRLIFNSSITA